LFLTVPAALAGSAPDDPLTAARAHVAAGRTAEAVAMLDSLERDLAGNRDFDVLFAQALLDAKDPARALFPINRLIRRNPDDAAALLLLSRARMALGQAEPARQALQRAQKAQQPPEVARRIDQYLSIIAAAEETGRTRIGGNLEIAFGHDSNVNSATGATQLALPVFGGAIGTLNAAATRQRSGFGSVSGSIGLKQPLTADLAVVAAVTGSQRWNFSEKDFDTNSIAGSVGLRYTSGNHEWTAIVNGDEFGVDYQRFRTAAGGSLQWRRALAPGSEISAFAQYAQLSYPFQSLRDADRIVGGIAIGQVLGSGPQAPIVFASAYIGEEDERNDNVPFFGHRLIGWRLGIDKGFTNRAGVSASVGFESRDYGGIDPLFLRGRFDQQWDARLAVPYAITQRLLIIPQVSHTYNKSNIELFKYRRTAAYVALKMLF
ncbi:MAG TPA: tetratricopeptide repeat protein, partial [Reyranella sp.]|nr:tetratricopeptide repeat protein [Reyranella sp.]